MRKFVTKALTGAKRVLCKSRCRLKNPWSGKGYRRCVKRSCVSQRTEHTRVCP